MNENLPEEYIDHQGSVHKEHIYATNQVITSKYTILTFIPRNLLEQFRRVANVCVNVLNSSADWVLNRLFVPAGSSCSLQSSSSSPSSRLSPPVSLSYPSSSS